MRVRAERDCDVVVGGVARALFAGQEYDLPGGVALPDGVVEVKAVHGPPEDKALKAAPATKRRRKP